MKKKNYDRKSQIIFLMIVYLITGYNFIEFKVEGFVCNLLLGFFIFQSNLCLLN